MDKEKLLERYKQYTDRIMKIHDQYKDVLYSEYEKALKTVVREELSAGSDMSLGYYHPSPVLDLIVGHVHRGKILMSL